MQFIINIIYLKKSSEEDVVNAMSNGMTELLTRTDLLQFIKHKLKEV